MKRIFLSTLLVLCLAATSFAQVRNWSVGLGVSTEYKSVSGSLYFNRNINKHWQIGLMPTTSYKQTSGTFSTHTENTFGLNLNSRFFILPDAKLKPYIFGYVGYLHAFKSTEDGSEITKSNSGQLTGSLGLGLQYNIGNKGWSIDLNGGRRWFQDRNKLALDSEYYYSIGLFKKF